jgi:hypothetical protein
MAWRRDYAEIVLTLGIGILPKTYSPDVRL